MVVSTIGLRLGAHLHPMAVDSLQDGSTLVKTLEQKLSIVKLLKVSVFAPRLCRSNQVGISHLATYQLNFFTTSSPSLTHGLLQVLPWSANIFEGLPALCWTPWAVLLFSGKEVRVPEVGGRWPTKGGSFPPTSNLSISGGFIVRG